MHLGGGCVRGLLGEQCLRRGRGGLVLLAVLLPQHLERCARRRQLRPCLLLLCFFLARLVLHRLLPQQRHRRDRCQHVLQPLGHGLIVGHRMRDRRGQMLECLFAQCCFAGCLLARTGADGELRLKRWVNRCQQFALRVIELAHL